MPSLLPKQTQKTKTRLLCLHVPFMHVIVEEHNSMTRTAEVPASSAGTVKMEI